MAAPFVPRPCRLRIMKTKTETRSTAAEPSVKEALFEPAADMTLEELLLLPNNPEAELLRTRFLCRGGGLLMVGPTGVGKSVLMMQAHFRWAVGLPFLGIEPARPLSSIIYNAENDHEDLQEMVHSCLSMTDFTPDNKAQALKNVRVVCDRTMSGQKFLEDLGHRVQAHAPDLVNIDPLLHYGGMDAIKQQDVSAFLRQGLTPIIEDRCGLVLVAHTAKPKREDKPAPVHEAAYSGFGSVEWANWCRGVLVLEPVDGKVFRLVAGKRGARLRWKNEQGEPVFHRDIKWTKQEGKLLWEPASEEEAAEARDNKRSRGKVPSWQETLGIFPHDSTLTTAEIKEAFKENRWDVNSYPALLSDLMERREVVLVSTHRGSLKVYGRPEPAQVAQERYDREHAERALAKKRALKEAGRRVVVGK